MPTSLIIIIAIDVLLIIGVLYRLAKRLRQLDFIKENYPAYLRQNTKGYLEYSVDHKNWSPVLQYCHSVKYVDLEANNTYIAPGLLYINVTLENKEGLEKKFNTVQKIWDNNTKALNDYHNAINSWLEENEKKES